MKHNRTIIGYSLLLVSLVAISIFPNGHSSVSTRTKLPVLPTAIRNISAYYNGPSYMNDLKAITARAKQYITQFNTTRKQPELADNLFEDRFKEIKQTYEKKLTLAARDAEKKKQAEIWYHTELNKLHARHFETKKQLSNKPTVIFDIDSTLLQMKPEILEDLKKGCFCRYSARDMLLRKDSSHSPVEDRPRLLSGLLPVVDLFQWAKQQGLCVAVISYRGDSATSRAHTIKNLEHVGCGTYDYLLLRPTGNRQHSDIVKNNLRKELVSKGCFIIASLGDQLTDFMGSSTGRGYKLPNYLDINPPSGTLKLCPDFREINAKIE